MEVFGKQFPLWVPHCQLEATLEKPDKALDTARVITAEKGNGLINISFIYLSSHIINRIHY